MTITVLFDLGPSLQKLGVKLVAALTDFTTKIDALKTTADAILTKIQELETQLATGGMTADDEAAVLAQLDDLKTHLDAAASA